MANQPAKTGPGRASAPAADNVGRKMHPEIDPTYTDQERQEDRHENEIVTGSAAGLCLRKQQAERQVSDCGEHGVVARKAEVMDLDQMGNEVRPRSRDAQLQTVADRPAAEHRNQQEERCDPLRINGRWILEPRRLMIDLMP